MKPSTSQFLTGLALATIACGTPGTDPLSVVPADAEAVLAVRPVARVGPGLDRVLDRLPEASGLFELVSSLTGVDLLSPERTRESGIDPDRGIALALWRDAALLVLPLQDESLGKRRIGLRLARLGFMKDEDGEDGTSRYRSTRGLAAACALEVRGGLGRVCLGNLERCTPGDGGLIGFPETVVAELSMPDAVLVGVVRNPMVSHLLDRSGVSLQGTARTLVQALLGDLRWALDAEGGLRARVAAGPVGKAFDPGPLAHSLPEIAAAFLTLNVPGAFLGRPVSDGLSALALARDRDVVRGLGAAWSGEAILAVLADPTAEPAPLVLDTAALGRLNWVAALGFAGEGGAGGALLALGELARRNGLVQTGNRFVGHGIGLEMKAQGQRVIAGSRTADLAGLPSESGGARVVHLAVDPGRLLQVLGGGGVEFLRHMVAAVPRVYLDLWFEPGRPILDAGVVIP